MFVKDMTPESIINEILSTNEPTPRLKEYYTQSLKNLGLEIRNIEQVYEDIYIGGYHELHTHLIPADFQVVVWAIPESFEGRDFVYGTKKKLRSYHPKNGDMCLMKTNDLRFVHGVQPLTSGSMVRTMLINVNPTTELGEHLTVRAGDLVSI
jgi:hypothetical protein